MCSVSEFKALCEKFDKHETQMDLLEKSFPPFLRTVRQFENSLINNTEKIDRLESTIKNYSEKTCEFENTIRKNSSVLESFMDYLKKIAEEISPSNSNFNIPIIKTTFQNEITNNVSLNGDAGSARKKSYPNN